MTKTTKLTYIERAVEFFALSGMSFRCISKSQKQSSKIILDEKTSMGKSTVEDRPKAF